MRVEVVDTFDRISIEETGEKEIPFRQGNIWNYAFPNLGIVIPTNTYGIAGAGMASEAAMAYPDWLKTYKKAPGKKGGSIGLCQINNLYLFWLNTKENPRNPSEIKWVEDGLDNLVSLVQEIEEVQALRLPLLGAGLGGLDSTVVLELTREKLAPVKETLAVSVWTYASVKLTKR